MHYFVLVDFEDLPGLEDTIIVQDGSDTDQLPDLVDVDDIPDLIDAAEFPINHRDSTDARNLINFYFFCNYLMYSQYILLP